MKKILFSILFVTTFQVLGYSQNVNVPETQVPVIMKVTASWCPFCGGWGWNFMENLYDDNEGDAILMPIHYSGAHTNSIASDIAVNLGAVSQPRFFLDGVDQNVSSGTATAKRTEIADKVKNSIAMNPSIQAGVMATYYMDDLNIEYSVKAFNILEGDYYIALYVAEKSFIGFQSGIGDNAEHLNLMREEASGNSFGTQVFSGNTAEGSIYDGSLSIPLAGYNPENLEVIAIIWKKEGNVFKIVNSNIDDSIDEQLTSGTIATYDRAQEKISVYPSVTRDKFSVEFDRNQTDENALLYLTDINGKMVFQSTFTPGEKNSFYLNGVDIAPGMYVISVISSMTRYNSRIIIK
jgi:hypothetical protein